MRKKNRNVKNIVFLVVAGSQDYLKIKSKENESLSSLPLYNQVTWRTNRTLEKKYEHRRNYPC